MELRKIFISLHLLIAVLMVVKIGLVLFSVIIPPWYSFWKTISFMMSNLGWNTISIFIAAELFIVFLQKHLCE